MKGGKLGVNYTKIACLSDEHLPFIDKKADELVKLFLKDLKPDKIIFLGDFIDLWQISKFDRSVYRQNTLQDDIQNAHEYLREFRDLFPKQEIIYLFGNHEERISKYTFRVAPELEGLIYLDKMLKLKELKIKHYKKQTDVHREGDLLFTHGTVVSQDSGMTCRRMLKKYGMSIIHGHTHRLGSHFKTDYYGMRGAWENGSLCDSTLAEEWRMGIADWQMGFSVVTILGNRFHVQQVPIIRNKIFFGDTLYKL